jgi:hypothetical protein
MLKSGLREVHGAEKEARAAKALLLGSVRAVHVDTEAGPGERQRVVGR